MGRPKGSKNKNTLIIEDRTKITPKKIENALKRKDKVKQPEHVLKLNDHLYITCDKYQFILKEVNNLTDKKGNPYPDISLLYSPYLDGILKVTAKYMSRIPADVRELGEKLDNIYDLIDARIPTDVRPRDLFVEFERNDTNEELDI